MQIVICGAGLVGTSIAEHLAHENNDVTIIDQNPALVRKISENLDVRGVVGLASHPNILDDAGIRDADMLIAVTFADEVNMVACQIAHSLFDVPLKIARVRQQEYLQPIWADLYSRDNMPIDHIISPEIEVARAINRRLSVPGALDVVSMADDLAVVVGVRCDDGCPIIDTPLKQLTELFPDLWMTILAIIRDGVGIVPSSQEMLHVSDEVYFVCDLAHLARAMAAFGHEETEARRIVIAGAGNIGLKLTEEIEREHPGVSVRLIEVNAERAKFVAQALPKSVILNGDILDGDIMEEAGISSAETFISVSNDDEVNFISCLLAKRYGVSRTIALINKLTYAPLIRSLGIDVAVNPRVITVSSILQHVRRGRIRGLHSVQEDFGEVIEVEVLETSPLAGKTVADVKLPEGVMLGVRLRGEKISVVRGSTDFLAGDRLVLFATYEAVKKVEKLFAVRFDFF